MNEKIIRNPEALNEDALSPNDGYTEYLSQVGNCTMEKNLAIVQTEISLHQTITALKQHAENYPAERIDQTQIVDIQEALILLSRRMVKAKEPIERRIGSADRRVVLDIHESHRVGGRRMKGPYTPNYKGRRSTDTKSWMRLPITT